MSLTSRATTYPVTARCQPEERHPVCFDGGMPTLLDEPADDSLRLLYAIAHGYQSVGSWACWQWVKQQLWAQRLDAEEIWQRLPTWRHG